MEDQYLIIYAGGTIGMAGKELAAHDPAAIDTVLQDLPLDADLIRLSSPYDSSALDSARVRELIHILEKHHKMYQGFLILFGTDTMAYLQSILKWAVSGLCKPIAITGSVRLPEEDPEEGPGNIRESLAYLRHSRGVASVAIIMGGKALLKSTTKFDASAALPYLQSMNSSLEYLRLKREENRIWDKPVFRKIPDARIEVLHCHPFLMVPEGPLGDGLILLAYGQGTLPPLQSLRERASGYVQAGKPVMILSQCPRNELDMRRYAGGTLLEELKIPAFSGSLLEEGLAYMLTL